MTSNEQVAIFLQTELQRRFGHVPDVEQVDIVSCECGCCIMTYIYFTSGDCEAVLAKRPQVLDPSAIEQCMLRGDATLH